MVDTHLDVPDRVVWQVAPPEAEVADVVHDERLAERSVARGRRIALIRSDLSRYHARDKVSHVSSEALDEHSAENFCAPDLRQPVDRLSR